MGVVRDLTPGHLCPYIGQHFWTQLSTSWTNRGLSCVRGCGLSCVRCYAHKSLILKGWTNRPIY